MSPLSLLFLRYAVAWLAMSAVLAILLFLAEGAYGFLSDWLGKKEGASASAFKTLVNAWHAPVTLPGTASPIAAVYAPALAIAALLPIPSCIPFFSFVPLLDNGGDLLQIVQFALMSEIFALISVWSIGTEQSREAGTELFFESTMLILSFAACFISIAFYLTANGIIGDTFSLNLITESLHFGSLRIYGKVSAAIFICLILAQAPYCATCSTTSAFFTLRMPGYDGPQRALLQLWASLRVFVVIALVTYLFFPWTLLRAAEAAAGGLWWMQAAHFALFWFFVVVVRVLLVPLLRKAWDYMQAGFTRTLSVSFILLLLGAAMILMYLEAYLSSLEAY